MRLERQGWKVVFANDIDPNKAEMYRQNWPKDDHLFVGDIHAINAENVPACDLFTASFPCNDLSIAGRWEGLNGKESSAFWGLVRIIRDMGNRAPTISDAGKRRWVSDEPRRTRLRASLACV